MTRERTHRSNLKQWLRLVGVALLAVLIVYADPRKLAAHLAGIRPGWVALGLALTLPQLGLKARRWQRLVNWQGIRFDYRRAFLAYFSSLLIGFLTPGRVGDMAKAFALRHETKVGLARAFSSVIIDRVFDLYLLVVLGLFSFTRFALIGPIVSRGAFAAICLMFLLPLFFLNEHVARWGGNLAAGLPVLSSRRRLIQEKVDEFADGLASLTPGRLLVCALLTLASYAVFFFQCHCCGRALGIYLQPLDLVLIMAATNLVGFLPFSISNLGTREASLIFFCRLLHPPVADALAVSWGLTQFVVFVVGGGFVGFVCWQIAPMGMSLSVTRMRRESEDAA